MNKNILKLHLELLDKKRQEVLQKLIPFTTDFVLGGGTALALQLVYFGDLRSFEVIPISKTALPAPNEVKKYFEELVKEYIGLNSDGN